MGQSIHHWMILFFDSQLKAERSPNLLIAVKVDILGSQQIQAKFQTITPSCTSDEEKFDLNYFVIYSEYFSTEFQVKQSTHHHKQM